MDTQTKPSRSSSAVLRQLRWLTVIGTVTLFVSMILIAYLSPLGYMTVTALKDRNMITLAGAPAYPAVEATFTYEEEEYPLYLVPTEDGAMHEWALYKKGREESTFIDPKNPGDPIQWVGRWRKLERVWVFKPKWENFVEAWSRIDMPLLLRNTVIIAVLGALGTTLSCIAVAYGFSRFRIPGKNALFMVLIATVILPGFVTIVPTYVVFQYLGWVGTWWPLIVPHFFANAFNVFLLRQFFMTVPRELDEAAMIDGANPFRTLTSIILPQSIPVIVAVWVGHFMWSWNDFFGPLLYLSTKPDLQTIAIGIQSFNATFFAQPQLVQAAALLGLGVPLLLFFLAQRVFMQGIVFTGVEK